MKTSSNLKPFTPSGSSPKKNDKKSYVKKSNKPAFVKVVIRLGESEYYNNEQITNLYDTLAECSFKKCAITAKMRKSLYFGDNSMKGYIEIGNITEWNASDESFTVSVTEYVLDKLEKIGIDKIVMIPSVRKNRDGIISYISTFDIQKGDIIEPIGFNIPEEEKSISKDEDISG